MTDAGNRTPTPPELAALRAELLAEVAPFAGRPEYAVTDPAFVDPFLVRAIESRAGGHLPSSDRERSDVLFTAGTALKGALAEAPGLSRIETLLDDRFAHPRTSRDGDTVTVDVGVIPGKLAYVRGNPFLRESTHIESGEWKSVEVARTLADAVAAHPDARRVRVVALIPVKDGLKTWTYEYDRKDDRVRIHHPDRGAVHASDPLGGDFGPYLRGEKSISTWKLKAE